MSLRLPAALADPRRALRVIAVFEAFKGFAALAAGLGLLGLVHHDVRQLAFALIGHFHMDPDGHYPRILVGYADLLDNADLRLWVIAAFAYAVIRFAEGYGLWRDRNWGEWLGALSGGIYIPFEIRHLAGNVSAINAAVLAGNVCVVAFLVYRLRSRASREAAGV